MGIHRGGYRQYQGPLLPGGTRFLVLAAAELARLLRLRSVRWLLVLGGIPLVVVVAAAVGKGVVEAAAGALPLSLDLMDRLFAAERFFLALLAAAAGAGLIAEDRGGNALVLYLSRPLTPSRYLAAKGLALAGILALVYLAPALSLALVSELLSPRADWLACLLRAARATAVAGLHVGAASALVLLLSSLATRARYAGLGWIALFFFSDALASGLAHGAGDLPWLRLLSLPDLLEDSGAWILGIGGRPAAAAVLAALAVVAALALWIRMRRLQAAAVVG
ncbi:MAG: hypothetical protein FJ098_08495 [Deltaproteobacteria bacterium]|nr:hypothetical protein [Deltaproteobacteria bacterium]